VDAGETLRFTCAIRITINELLSDYQASVQGIPHLRHRHRRRHHCRRRCCSHHRRRIRHLRRRHLRRRYHIHHRHYHHHRRRCHRQKIDKKRVKTFSILDILKFISTKPGRNITKSKGFHALLE
jgi:hypothetical protein